MLKYASGLIEMKNILDALLEDGKPEIEYPKSDAIRYEDIKTSRVNGKRAVILPNGKMLGKAMDRKLGCPIWTIVGTRTIG